MPGRPGLRGRTAADNRLFVDTVLWIGKTGAPWRDLPERLGNCNNVFRRFDRWANKGIWKAVFEALQDPHLEWLILDSTVIRAHPHAAEAKKSRWDGRPGRASPGRSRGGFGTKIHVGVSGLGLPLTVVLTPGQSADVTQAGPLTEGIAAEVVIGDKGYDSDALVEAIRGHGAEAVYRRVATRYQKTAQNFLAFVHVASIMILLQ